MKVGDFVKRRIDGKEYKVLFIGVDSVVVENVETKRQTIYWMRSFKKTFEVK